MGYRRLLQSYLKHVEQVLGTSLVELSSASPHFTKRDLGQLRVLSAELERERFRASSTNAEAPDSGALLAAAIRSYGLTVEETAAIAGVDEVTVHRWCDAGFVDVSTGTLDTAEFSRVLLTLICWNADRLHTRKDYTNKV